MPDDQRIALLTRGNEMKQGTADIHAGLPPDPTGAIMSFNKFIGVCGGFPQADKSAMGTINRPLQVCRRCVRYPRYFVTVHYRGPTIMNCNKINGICRPHPGRDESRSLDKSGTYNAPPMPDYFLKPHN